MRDAKGRCSRRMLRNGGLAFAASLAVVGAALAGEDAASGSRAVARPAVSFGVASGEVSATSALVWARTDGPATAHFEVAASGRFSRAARRIGPVAARAAADYAVTVPVRGLKPGTRYAYRVWFSRARRGAAPVLSRKVTGSFRTAPARTTAANVGFVFSGDLGGNGFCRRADGVGYPIFRSLRALGPSFFLANGDMIYADTDCPATRPDGGGRNLPSRAPNVRTGSLDWTQPRQVRSAYFQHWRYNRADPVLRAFLNGVPIYSQWDDHEVIDDFGGSWQVYPRAPARPGYRTLVASGANAFRAYGVVGPGRFYRSFSWGRNLDLFLLDGRSYRSRNDAPDSRAKTMLGAAQLAWLKRGLSSARGTWKVVTSNVSLSLVSGDLRTADAWANGGGPTGFETELLGLLRFLDARNVDNVVFLVGDSHYPHFLRHEADFDGDGDALLFHELVVGPLSAQLGARRELDPTTAPRTLYAETGIFAFGYARVRTAGGRAHFLVDVRDDTGRVRPGSALDLSPR